MAEIVYFVHMNQKSLIFALFLGLSGALYAQETVTGAQVLTHENYLYGRFEVAMQSAPGNGIVSSFFLYNWDIGCNWPAENNEIDIEMTGNDEDLHFTTHYPGPWFFSDEYEVEYNPHEEMVEYAIEWVPGTVRWYIEDELVYTQNESFVDDLIHPMRVFMNLWVANAVNWVGPWDPAVLPRSSHYDFVKVYNYTPGTGDAGTGNNFTLDFEDHFDGDALNPDIWEITDFGDFEGNLAGFYQQNVSVADGLLTLTLNEPGNWIITVPVTFQVDMSNVELEATDVVYLNGGFNNWCGTCAPMSDLDGDNIYTLTVNIEPGEHEYLFTLNFWEELGGAPEGSECDYQPCDEFHNYGFQASIDDTEIILPPVCWGTCSDCGETSVTALTAAPASVQLWENEVRYVASPGATLEVFDLQGRRVYTQLLDSAEGTVTLPSSVQGWSAVRVSGEDTEARTHGIIK